MKPSKSPPGRRSFLTLALACCAGLVGPPTETVGAEDAPEVVRVLTFNLWQGGDAGKQPLDRTIEVIERSRADIVGLQETGGIAPKGQPRPDRAAEIAERLGWHYLDQGSGRGVVSRFEIVGSTPRKWGVKLRLPSGRTMYAFNIHFAAAPYQPYQILRIPYGDGDVPFIGTEEEAIRGAEGARGEQVASLIPELKEALDQGVPVVLTGDFNEPSRLDWTHAAVEAKACPMKVDWPATRAVEEAGLVDAYRAVHPDPVKSPGLTWTPITSPDDPKDRHDRIDLVFVGGVESPADAVKAAKVIGEAPETADVVVNPYPSDHRAVVAELEL